MKKLIVLSLLLITVCGCGKKPFSVDPSLNNQEALNENTEHNGDTNTPDTPQEEDIFPEYVGKLETLEGHGDIYSYLDGDQGLILCFHGTFGSAAGWSNANTEKNDFLQDLAKIGWSFLCPTSLDRDIKQWNPTNNSTNLDVINVENILEKLKISVNIPLLIVGHSNGGGFSSRYAVFATKFINIQAIQFSNSTGLRRILEDPSYNYPTLFNYTERDDIVDSLRVRENFEVLNLKLPNMVIQNQLDAQYEARGLTNFHEFLNTSDKILELMD